MIINHAIRQIRLSQDLTLKQLAKRMGVSANYISMLESRKTSHSMRTVSKIARALNVPLVALVEFDSWQYLQNLLKELSCNFCEGHQLYLIESNATYFTVGCHECARLGSSQSTRESAIRRYKDAE